MAEQILGAAEAKAHFLRLLTLVEGGNGTITVTRRGRPVARIVPVAPAKSERKELWGALKGTIVAYDRPFDPACDPEEWSAINGEEDDLY